MEYRPRRNWDGRPTPRFRAPAIRTYHASFVYPVEPHFYRQIASEDPRRLVQQLQTLPSGAIIKRIWDECPGDTEEVILQIARQESHWRRLARQHRGRHD